MRVTQLLLTLLVLALFAGVLTGATPSLEDIENDIAMLEADADADADADGEAQADVDMEADPAVASALDAAQSYADSKLAAAQAASEQILAAAAEAGKSDAVKAGPLPVAPKKVENKQMAALLNKMQADKKASDAAAAAVTQKVAAAGAKQSRRRRRLAAFQSQRLAADSRGVFGGVTLGLPKAEALPTTIENKNKDATATLRKKQYKGKRNIYGKQKACLKDIAAHFDERDIYESKKLSLLQRLESTRSAALAKQLQQKLSSLETWHQMMQKKFLLSSNAAKIQRRRLEKLFDAHLPDDMKKQLRANKAAAAKGEREPYPQAHAQAVKYLQRMRDEIQSKHAAFGGAFNLDDVLGKKKMIRPEINDPEFPSMDPISTELRGQLWRRVKTQHPWSTDLRDFERAGKVVDKAHKGHEDFVYGPIAAPLLKGKLYEPETEVLGQPDFLRDFPWPKEVEKEVNMDEKLRVEQTDFQTY